MKAHNASQSMSIDEIIWQESGNIYQPLSRRLPEFTASIELSSPGSFSTQQGDLRVFLRESCLKQMKHHAKNDVLREQAGILCGQVYIDDGEFYIAVTSAFPVNAVSDLAHFKFDETSWEEIWGQLDHSCTILGWYHTHPGMGVFLSATDARTQKQHFSSPWQIAIVIDPVSGQSGLFAGSEGRPLPADRIHVYREKQ
jgi:proteasome lid subunit RPN8/RPN11